MLKMWAVVRGDLQMSPGKLAAQAGHAFVESFLAAPEKAKAEYRQDSMGTKIVLKAPSLRDILATWDKVRKHRKIPSSLIIDSGHVMPPHFGGAETITALGIGPADPEIVKELLQHYALA